MTELGADGLPVGMEHVYMPADKSLKQYGLSISDWVRASYKHLAVVFLGNYKSFGVKNGKSELPEAWPVPKVENSGEASIPNYDQRVQRINTRYQKIVQGDGRVAAATNEVAELVDQGQGEINTTIQGISDFAAMNPADPAILTLLTSEKVGFNQADLKVDDHGGVTEDSFLMCVIEWATTAAEHTINTYARQLEEQAKTIDGANPQNGAGKDEGSGGTGLGAGTGPGSWDGATTTTGDSGAPPPWNWDTQAGLADGATGMSANDRSAARSALGDSGSTASNMPATMQASPTPTASPGSGMAGYMLPAMMSTLGQMNQPKGENKPKGDGTQGYKREGVPGVAVARTASATAPPAQPAGAPQGQSTASPVRAAATAVAANTAVTRPQEADGSVLYTFPDGRTQNVSPVVAQVLDAAFGNAASTDARFAYEKTPAKWSDTKQLGPPVHPPRTGYVGTWAQRTAVLVVFGLEDGTGTVEAVIDGQLKQVPPDKLDEMSDSAGEFGNFTGFFQPPGIETTPPAPDAAALVPTPPADQQVVVAAAPA